MIDVKSILPKDIGRSVYYSLGHKLGNLYGTTRFENKSYIELQTSEIIKEGVQVRDIMMCEPEHCYYV